MLVLPKLRFLELVRQCKILFLLCVRFVYICMEMCEWPGNMVEWIGVHGPRSSFSATFDELRDENWKNMFERWIVFKP